MNLGFFSSVNNRRRATRQESDLRQRQQVQGARAPPQVQEPAGPGAGQSSDQEHGQTGRDPHGEGLQPADRARAHQQQRQAPR